MNKFCSWFKDHFAFSLCHVDDHFLIVVFGRVCFTVGIHPIREYIPADYFVTAFHEEDY